MKYTAPIAKLMKRANFTSADVESICSVSRQTVHNWRKGTNDPQAENVSRLIVALKSRGVEADISEFFSKRRTRRAA